jgi:cytochrome c biogenesis protein CcmG/thiol:disulfide interchange protein DsbE
MMRYFPILVFALLCMLFAGMLLSGQATKTTLPSPLISKPFPEIVLPEIHQNKAATVNSESLKGRITILNVFASWCVPCLAEHPLWANITTAHQVDLIGIGWKDSPDNLSKWLDTHGNPYTRVLVDTRGESTTPLGITGVPETYIVDANGMVRYKLSMPLTENLIADEILPLLEQLRGAKE